LLLITRCDLSGKEKTACILQPLAAAMVSQQRQRTNSSLGKLYASILHGLASPQLQNAASMHDNDYGDIARRLQVV
jgi:hypothetical protein